MARKNSTPSADELRQLFGDALIERDLYHFVKWAFPIVHGRKELVDNWHIVFLCAQLQHQFERWMAGEDRDRHLSLNVPPRTLKSFITTICYPAWVWARAPHCKIWRLSYSATMMKSHAIKCRNLIKSPEYQALFGDRFRLSEDENTIMAYSNNRGGAMVSAGLDGSITGLGGDIGIIDDAQNPKKAESETERINTISAYTDTVSSRLDDPDKGFFVNIQQRLHRKDLTGYLMANEPDEWKFIVLPAWLNKALRPMRLSKFYVNDLLFPQRLSRRFLGQQERRGRRLYNGQYGQEPIKEGGNIYKPDSFKRFGAADLPSNYVVHFYMDTAYTDSTENDPSGIIAYTVVSGKLYVLNWTTVHLEFPQFIEYAKSFLAANGYSGASRVYIEPKASGKSIASAMRQFCNADDTSDKVSGTKKERAYAATPSIDAGRVLVPYDDDPKFGGPWVKQFLDGLALFPDADHDEDSDCLSGAIRMGLSQSLYDGWQNTVPGQTQVDRDNGYGDTSDDW